MKNYLLPALILLTAAAGCSVKVDVADENTTTAEAPPSITAEKSRTAVEVGFLVDREPEATASERSKTVQPEPEPAPQPPTPDPPSRETEDLKSESDRRSVTVVQNVINIQHVDIERHHDTHYHFYEPRKSSRESAKVRVEVVQKPARDERCSRLLREYEEKAAEWKQMMERGGQK